MNKDLTLLILAAGMSTRFGSLKQIEPVGPWGEFIIDYSVYDAIEAGFTKVVFVINEENYYDFKDTIGKRLDDKIEVEYVFQKIDDLPAGYKFKDRKKPWGTAHAVRAARKVINEPFGLISADDFYGKDAFIKLANYLKNVDVNSYDYSLVAYPLKETLSEQSTVKRGVVNKDGDMLTSIIESEVKLEDNKILARPLFEDEYQELKDNSLASMLMFGFTPTLFDLIESEFPNFLSSNKEENDTKEFLLPVLLQTYVNKNISSLKVIEPTSKWHGVTYKEDKEKLEEAIKALIANQQYKDKLWKED